MAPPADEVRENEINFFIHAQWRQHLDRYYATQVERYLEFFSQDRVLTVDQDDLLHRRASALRGIFAFLGVDSEYESEPSSSALNVRDEKLRFNRLGRSFARRGFKRLAPHPPGQPPRALRRLCYTPIETPVLNASTQERLLSLLGPEAHRLRALTGQPFWSWSV